MGDLLELLATILLIGANAFFVAAEFSLISARRDRLEALAEQGRSGAFTVIRAGEQLPLMFAGAQLGVTVSSILLGRIGEPAVADLLRRPFDLLGASPALLHTASLLVALAIVVTLHLLLGEIVPKNIAMAGPERAAMLLIPVYLVYARAVRPVVNFYSRCNNGILRALRVRARDELDVTVSTVELSEMIAESVSEGLLDREEHTRLTRALQIRNRTVADVAVPVAEIRAVPVAAAGSGPTVDVVEKALAATGYSRFPVVGVDNSFVGYLHIKDVLSLAGDPQAVIDLARVRPLPRISESLSVPEALSRMRRSNSHLALVTARDGGAVVAMVALEDLVRDLVGLVRDGTAACLTTRPAGWMPSSGRPAPTTTPRASRDSSPRTRSGPRSARRIRCGTSCSATTACGRGSCAAGIPATGWCSPARQRHPPIPGPPWLRRRRVRSHRQPRVPAQPAGDDLVRGAVYCARPLSGRPSSTASGCTNGRWSTAAATSATTVCRCASAPRAPTPWSTPRSQDRCAAATSTRSGFSPPKRRRATRARPAAPHNRIGSSPAAFTPTWTCTNGPTS